LNILLLQENHFSGSLSALSTNASRSIFWALLHKNAFTGAVPWAEIFSGALMVLSLAENQLTGTIPGPLPSSLQRFMINDNHFTGDLMIAPYGIMQCLAFHDQRRSLHRRPHPTLIGSYPEPKPTFDTAPTPTPNDAMRGYHFESLRVASHHLIPSCPHTRNEQT